MKTTIKTLAILSTLSFFASCSDDDAPQVINEEEVITTVEYTLTNTADATNVVVYKSVDADGDGPNPPIVTTTGVLMANSSYMGSVQFLNEAESPAENITEEVEGESDEHEVFYIASIPDVMIAKDDVDVNGNPLGVMTTFQTGAVSTGNLTVVLRHEPMKPNDGSLSNAGGETDVQVVFDLTIQ
ncbi:MAG: type 1 periplasmic binding fold superfamily protein [Nonlabens sp.]|uniref:type 1 periplasmic binding fold superfamily protein n=1 Tax=Nonlabens sp. TaxID=1888209 RepID=UPI003EF61C4B